MRTPRRLLAPVLVLLAAACADGTPLAVEDRPAEPGSLTFASRCEADLRSGSVRCGAPELPGGISALIAGSPYVTLTSSNVNYNSTTERFTFDVTVKNGIGQAIGTTDGSTVAAEGVRAFFHSGPNVTSGTGTITVLGDGIGTFTASNQPYYQYNTVLDSGEVSSAKTWTLAMPPTVLTFSFIVYVSAPVRYPNGWLTVSLSPTTVSVGGTPAIATAQVRSAYGAVVTSGTVSWSTGSGLVASATPIDARTAEIHGNGGGFSVVTGSYNTGSATITGSAWIGVF